MNKKVIYLILVALATVIILFVINDFTNKRPDKRASNPYEYDLSDLKKVDSLIILYRETKNLNLKIEKLRGIAVHENRIFVIGDKLLQGLDINGNLILDIKLTDEPTALAVNENNILIGLSNKISVYNHKGTEVGEWMGFSVNSRISSIGCYNDGFFVADAGLRVVYRFNFNGQKELVFDGKNEEYQQHGFIVPSGYFDLAINEFGDLWVANPGKHSLENYTFDGKLRGYWSATSADIKGFTGCCNPSHFAFLPDGNFVTSEKGILRVKIYKPSGEFLGVVASPSNFFDEGNVSDVAADKEGRVYVCDPDKKSIRIFEKI